jgi:acyl-CoA thioesterase-1
MHGMPTSRQRSKRKRISSSAVVIGLVAVTILIVIAGFVWDRQRGTVAVPEGERYDTGSFESHPYPRLTVIGDSYSAGTYSNVKWPDLFAAKRTWYVNNIAEGGSGYTAGDAEDMFGAKVAEAAATTPDIVMVVGSRNDQYNPRQAGAAASEMFAGLKAQLPGVPIFIIGPIWDSTAPPQQMRDANDSIRDAAQRAGLPFVDALAEDWLADPGLIAEDGKHPNDRGQEVLADRINTVAPQVTIPQ